MNIYNNNNYIEFSLCNYRKNGSIDAKMERAIEFKLKNLALIKYQFIVAYHNKIIGYNRA